MSTGRSTKNSDYEKKSYFKNGTSRDKIIYKAKWCLTVALNLGERVLPRVECTERTADQGMFWETSAPRQVHFTFSFKFRNRACF